MCRDRDRGSGKRLGAFSEEIMSEVCQHPPPRLCPYPHPLDARAGNLLAVVQLEALQAAAVLQVLQGHVGDEEAVVQFQNPQPLVTAEEKESYCMSALKNLHSFYPFADASSLGSKSVTLSGGPPGGGGPSGGPDLQRRERCVAGAPGRRALRAPRGSSSPGPAQSCPAPQPRRPQPGLSATPAPPAGTERWPRGGSAPAGKGRVAQPVRAPDSPWPKSRERAHSPESQGAGNARCPGDASWAPRPVPKVGSEAAIGGFRARDVQGGAVWTSPCTPTPIRASALGRGLFAFHTLHLDHHHPDHLDIPHLTYNPATGCPAERDLCGFTLRKRLHRLEPHAGSGTLWALPTYLLASM
ncbi:hypothetical protein GH733_002464 [Mirounga leonina]|nr:hypothetical protein GH733_002464 [Mirounga leonina]